MGYAERLPIGAWTTAGFAFAILLLLSLDARAQPETTTKDSPFEPLDQQPLQQKQFIESYIASLPADTDPERVMELKGILQVLQHGELSDYKAVEEAFPVDFEKSSYASKNEKNIKYSSGIFKMHFGNNYLIIQYSLYPSGMISGDDPIWPQRIKGSLVSELRISERFDTKCANKSIFDSWFYKTPNLVWYPFDNGVDEYAAGPFLIDSNKIFRFRYFVNQKTKCLGTILVQETALTEH